jgi:hypothetical protein
MLAATDALRTGAADDEADRASALRSASAQAELISSPQLFHSGSIAALARAATSGGDEEYRRARDAFVAAARADGLANSAAFRWMRRGVYRRDP